MADLAVDHASSAATATPILLLDQLASAILSLQFLLALLVVFLYNFLEFHFLQDLRRGFRGDGVRLTFNSASEVYHGVASKCRILHGRYLATPWLSSPHLQTAFLNFFGNAPSFHYRRQIFRAPDGGTFALDWLVASDVLGTSSNTNEVISGDDPTPILVVIPGLTSDCNSSYVKHLAYKIAERGWNVVVCNHRGLGGISITSDCFYNAGWTEDTRVVINHLHRKYPKAPLFAVGTSVGANIMVKYLGEDGDNTPVAGAASICSPWDLVVCDRFMNRKLVQRLYNRVLAIGLKGYALLHQPVISRLADWESIQRSRSVRDFDNYATRVLGKYETVDTYYRRCSSVSFLGNVAVPLLCISTMDDPVCTKEVIPWDECRANKNIILATTTHGGHLAFFQGFAAGDLWWVDAVDEFLSVLHSSPFMHDQKKVPATGMHSSLDSVIDKAPYVNIMGDGMVTAVDNGGVDINFAEEHANVETGKASYVENSEVEAGNARQHAEHANVETANKPPQFSEREMSRETSIDSIKKVVAAMKKPLKQVSWWSSNSMWLLVYIAIVTTWPFVGSILFTIFKKRIKGVLVRAP